MSHQKFFRVKSPKVTQNRWSHLDTILPAADPTLNLTIGAELFIKREVPGLRNIVGSTIEDKHVLLANGSKSRKWINIIKLIHQNLFDPFPINSSISSRVMILGLGRPSASLLLDPPSPPRGGPSSLLFSFRAQRR